MVTIERGKPCWLVFEHEHIIRDCSGTLVDADNHWLVIRDGTDCFDCPRHRVIRLEELPCQN